MWNILSFRFIGVLWKQNLIYLVDKLLLNQSHTKNFHLGRYGRKFCKTVL